MCLSKVPMKTRCKSDRQHTLAGPKMTTFLTIGSLVRRDQRHKCTLPVLEHRCRQPVVRHSARTLSQWARDLVKIAPKLLYLFCYLCSIAGQFEAMPFRISAVNFSPQNR